MPLARVTRELLEPLLEKCGGNLAWVARRLGVDRAAVRRFIGKHPDLAAALRDARESMKDDAEARLHAAALRGEAWAVCFYLKCQAKDRGYNTRVEAPGVGAGEIARAVRRLLGAPPGANGSGSSQQTPDGG